MPENQLDSSEAIAREKGDRAEEVAAWYFRLNGFFSIPSFIVHLDKLNVEGDTRPARTEADLMAVRFPHSREVINGNEMTDHLPLVSCGNGAPKPKVLFVLVEVKTSLCMMNGPWTDKSKKNMQRVIRRFGVAPNDKRVNEVAAALYETARWEGLTIVIQYVCVGGRKNDELQNMYPSLLQIDWDDIGDFLFTRFRDFPEKLPGGPVHKQWPEFGKIYGDWFQRKRISVTSEESKRAVKNFIQTGKLHGF